MSNHNELQNHEAAAPRSVDHDGPPTRHPVCIVVSLEQALAAMNVARVHDVERGGLYDVRSAAINNTSLASARAAIFVIAVLSPD